MYNAGCELEIGRGVSTVHWDELLDGGAPVLRARDRRQPPSRVRLGPRLDVGPVRADGSRRARCAPHGLLLRQHRAAHHRLVQEEGRSRCTAIPCRVVTGRLRRLERGAVNAGRLGYRYGGEILAATPDGLITAARLDLPETAPYARVEVADARGGRAWTNPL